MLFCKGEKLTEPEEFQNITVDDSSFPVKLKGNSPKAFLAGTKDTRSTDKPGRGHRHIEDEDQEIGKKIGRINDPTLGGVEIRHVNKLFQED